MKTKINPYLKYLLLENIAYIIIALVLLIGFLIIPTIMLNAYSNNSNKIIALQNEIQDIKAKKNTLAFISGSKLENVDDYYNIVSALLPDSENYFSIIYALDTLSSTTNFNITSYSINLSESTNNKLSIQVTGVGDQQDFLNFLQQYNFGGGRLITAEKIDLNSQEFSGITLSLNFYNQKASLASSLGTDYQKVLARIDQIKGKINYEIQPPTSSESANIEDYPKKTNPF